ncbi:MAG: tetratricopeptide repeat protein [Candidatus Riflebacteria bacterium]|nr:tetratricopeptide repeat protein [Candidatus Riflebacteria bacterium]
MRRTLRRGFGKAILTAIVAWLPITYASGDIEGTAECILARQNLSQNNFDGAVQALQPLLANPQTAAEAKIEIARARQKQAENELTMALSHFNEAATNYSAGLDEGGVKGPDSSKVLYDLGRIYEERVQNPSKAAEVYEKLMADHPTFLSIDKVAYNLAGCYEKLGRNEDATRMYKEIVTKYPYSTFFQIAQTRMRSLAPGTSMAKDAIEIQQGVVDGARSEGQAAKAQLDLAAMHASQGDNKKAIEEYKKILSDAPGTDAAKDASARMAALMDKEKDYKGEVAALEDLVKQNGNEPGNDKNLMKLGRLYEDNISDMKTRTTADGQVLKKVGDENVVKAIEYYDRITESYPDADVSADALLRKGDLYRSRLKDTDEAKKQYQDFLKRFPDHPEADSVREKVKKLDSGDSD